MLEFDDKNATFDMQEYMSGTGRLWHIDAFRVWLAKYS
jgi:hypothetical protein